MRCSFLRLVALFLGLFSVTLAEREVRQAPAAAWIVGPEEIATTATNTAAEPAAEIDYLLIDRQINVAAAEDYVRILKRVVSEQGLQDAGRVSVSYDPSYESVVLHGLRVRRNGGWDDRLPQAEIRYLEQESQSDRHLYNGRVTALVLLPDIRVGDEVEYSYTRHGRNPVFSGRFFETISLGYSEALRRLRVRVVSDSSRPIHHRQLGPAAAEPSVQPADGRMEHLWDLADVPAYVYEEDSPSWYLSYPEAQLSDFASWAEVVDWARPLYAAIETPLAPDLAAAVASLGLAERSAEEQAAALLEFVQREIRYLGMELGESSHQPHAPEVTWGRRFGDCKDKAVVLAQLLRSVGLPAVPVLVDGERGRALQEAAPSPGAFDHVIVGVAHSGGWWWLDPTLTPGGGKLVHRAAPDYGWVLPLEPGRSELARMSVPAAARRRIESKETFRVRAWDQPVELDVVTTYFGASAASVLNGLQQQSAKQLQQSYEEYYHAVYPQIEMTEPVRWEQSPDDGSLTVWERYAIADFWTPAEAGGSEAEVYPLLIDGYLPRGVGSRRTAPRELAHPVTTKLIQRIEFPETWPLPADPVRLDGDAFTFSRRNRGHNTPLVETEYEYRSKRDHVLPGGMREYVADLAKARAKLGYTLTYDPAAAAFRLNVWMVLLAIASALVTSLAIGWWTRRCSQGPPPLPQPGPTGLGGWLVLPFLGVLAVIVILGWSFSHDLRPAFDAQAWANLGGMGDINTQVQLVYEIAGNAALLAASAMLVGLMLARRRVVRALYPSYLIFRWIFVLADTAWTAAAGNAETPGAAPVIGFAVGMLLPVIIWVAYFRKSRRVWNTFIR